MDKLGSLIGLTLNFDDYLKTNLNPPQANAFYDKFLTLKAVYCDDLRHKNDIWPGHDPIKKIYSV